MKDKVILYGAGNNAGKAIKYLDSLTNGDKVTKNYEIVGFVDKDPAKWGKTCNGFEVRRFEDVDSSSNYYWFITPSEPARGDIQYYLEINGIKKDKIIGYKDYQNGDEYVSCYSLENVAIVDHNAIYSCCLLNEELRNYSPLVRFEDCNYDMEKTVEQFLNRRKQIITALRAREENPCEGCSELRYGKWGGGDKITELAISPSVPCQIACEYCNIISNAKNIFNHQKEVNRALKFDIVEFVKTLEHMDVLEPSQPIQLSAGEITVNKNKKEILDYLRKYPLQIFSNCVLYDEQISELCAHDRSFLNASIDAGTRDTYHKVKGIDAWDRVNETLKKYSENGCNIELKYIIMPDNSDDSDLEGFMNLCKKIKPQNINISCDLNIKPNEISEKMIDAAIFIAKKSNEYGLAYRILPYFGEKNMNKIKKGIDNEK